MQKYTFFIYKELFLQAFNEIQFFPQLHYKKRVVENKNHNPNPSKVFQQFQSLVLLRLQRSSLTPPLQQGNLIAAPCLHRAQVALPPLRQRFRRFHLHSPSASPLLPHRVKPISRTNQSCEGQLLRFHSSLSETANAQEKLLKGGFHQPKGRCAAHCQHTLLPRHQPTAQGSSTLLLP